MCVCVRVYSLTTSVTPRDLAFKQGLAFIQGVGEASIQSNTVFISNMSYVCSNSLHFVLKDTLMLPR